MRRGIKLFLTFIILLFTFIPTRFAHAQGSVEFSDFSSVNHFPQEAVFSAHASSDGSQIVSAQFVFSSDGYYSTESYSKIAVDIRPGQDVDLDFTWFTGGGTALPWSYITYYWDVVDADGNHYRSDQLSFRYDDVRFDWQSLENNDISVWWHDRSASFGQGVFDIAARAVRDQRNVFQTDLDYPVRIVIYNTFDEYAEWRGNAHEWVGGETYPDYGVTVQIVESSFYQKSWLEDVIPHEISHLYFAQATHNPTVSVPTWLNEGVSQYNEYGSNTSALNNARDAAKGGDLIPLSKLADGFGGYNQERVYLAYDESLSAVKYFADTFGEKSLGALLHAYKEGKTTNDAFKAAIGMDAGAFEAQWATYLGIPDNYVTPTPWALPTFRPAPTMAIIGQAPPTPKPKPTRETVPTEPPATGESTPNRPSLPCTSFAPVLALGLGTLFYRGNRRKGGKHV